MSANARVVTVDTTFTWDGGEQFLRRGTILDVPPGSALLAAIGADRLASLYRTQPVTVAAAPPTPAAPAPVPAAPALAARKTRSKTSATDKAGGGGDGELTRGSSIRDVTVTWDMVSQRIARGTVIDVPAASALLTALGAGNLTALTTQQQSCDGGVSVGPFMENLTGGGQEPYVWAQ